jgi:hypothetical protein
MPWFFNSSPASAGCACCCELFIGPIYATQSRLQSRYCATQAATTDNTIARTSQSQLPVRSACLICCYQRLQCRCQAGLPVRQVCEDELKALLVLASHDVKGISIACRQHSTRKADRCVWSYIMTTYCCTEVCIQRETVVAARCLPKAMQHVIGPSLCHLCRADRYQPHACC